MSEKARVMTKHLRRFDSGLFCKKIPKNGAYGVYQKTVSGTHLILPLTDNWRWEGRPVDWGIEPVLFKLRFGSPERDVSDELIKGYQKADESRERDLKRNTADFLGEYRSQFAKATNDVNTSTLEKVDSRRMKHGY